MSLLATWLQFLMIVLGTLAAGCDQPVNADGPAMVPMKIGKSNFNLEIANTEASRNKGLMHRKSMPRDQGMIFVFPDSRVREFWMRNTHIPLDIVFVSTTGKVVAIASMKPHDENETSSNVPAKWAIELNQGVAKECGVEVGDMLKIPDEARKARDER